MFVVKVMDSFKRYSHSRWIIIKLEFQHFHIISLAFQNKNCIRRFIITEHVIMDYISEYIKKRSIIPS